nr:MAG TPA: hypothetical protein [Bacteriophage sp.]
MKSAFQTYTSISCSISGITKMNFMGVMWVVLLETY